jgi:hypothetical protein
MFINDMVSDIRLSYPAAAAPETDLTKIAQRQDLTCMRNRMVYVMKSAPLTV